MKEVVCPICNSNNIRVYLKEDGYNYYFKCNNPECNNCTEYCLRLRENDECYLSENLKNHLTKIANKLYGIKCDKIVIKTFPGEEFNSVNDIIKYMQNKIDRK
jgi:hypothetical protein